MTKIAMRTRRDIIDRQRVEYKKANKKRKGEILTSICEATGLSRDRAARLMSAKGSKRGVSKKETRGRKKIYGKREQEALTYIWGVMDLSCGKRMVQGIDDVLDALLRSEELRYDDEVIDNLRRMSASTMDRLLEKERQKNSLKGRSTTKPGTLLKKDIPFRLGTEWDDALPGYVEIDLVAHCGASTAGEYVNTLDVTDICTGWTETEAVINKAQIHVFQGLVNIETRQPFPYSGIDSDNGSEFINSELNRYCKDRGICFTRSRPYTKNDNCHVEQKNWHIVRRNIGYDRYEGQRAVDLLNEYYRALRLHYNFFLPQIKLILKERTGSRVIKKYDTPKTPFRRVLESEYIPQEKKAELTEVFKTLNPAGLQREMLRIQKELLKICIPWSYSERTK